MELLPCILLVLGLALLVKGADWLVDGGSALGKRLNISELVIGLTIVAFGTSLPELFVNIFASASGNTEIAISNVIGSNIFNILIILGLAAIIHPLGLTKGTVWKEIPFSLLAVIVLIVLINDHIIDGKDSSSLARGDGLILLAFFLIFLYYTGSIAKNKPEHSLSKVKQKKLTVVMATVLVVVGLVSLAIGGKLTVHGAIAIASKLGISQTFIGLTIIAVGTSLPELATSIVAAYKNKPDIAVGNIVGSNIFNIFLILGISSLIRPLPIPAVTNRDIGVCVIASLLLFISAFTGKRRTIDRWEGWIMVAIYVVYILLLISGAQSKGY